MKNICLFTITFAWLLSGCVNLKPQPDHTQIFALASDVPAVTDLEGAPECYVARVELPGYLEGTRIYYRSANGALDSLAGARWAEAPVEGLPRAIAMHLLATGKAQVRAYYPWSNTTREAATISVQFERFSANAAGQVEVVAQWQIESKRLGKIEGRYFAPALKWDGKDSADYVAKLNAALAGLAAEIAAKL